MSAIRCPRCEGIIDDKTGIGGHLVWCPDNGKPASPAPVGDGLVADWDRNMYYLKLVYGPYNGNAITWAVAMLEHQAATIARLEQEIACLKQSANKE